MSDDTKALCVAEAREIGLDRLADSLEAGRISTPEAARFLLRAERTDHATRFLRLNRDVKARPEDLAEWVDALWLSCPTCTAAAGQECASSGGRTSWPHKPRLEATTAARWEAWPHWRECRRFQLIQGDMT